MKVADPPKGGSVSKIDEARAREEALERFGPPPINGRKSADGWVELILEAIDRIEKSSTLVGEDATKIAQHKVQLVTSWAVIIELMESIDPENSDLTELLFGNFSRLISSSFLIGTRAFVSDSTNAFARRSQASLARDRRSKRTAEKTEKLRAAISKVATGPLEGTHKFAESIRDAVRTNMGIESENTWPSVRTIQRAIADILQDCG